MFIRIYTASFMKENHTSKSWIEVSVVVEAELAEPVAEVLVDYLSKGVVLETLQAEVPPQDAGQSPPSVRVYGYLPVDEQLENRQRKIQEALYYLGTIRSIPQPTFTELEDENWASAWQKRYRPLPLGSNLIIVPTWLSNPDSSRLPIFLDPGMAFGSGTHPTTQLCIELIAESLAQQPSARMIDIGCGSGILSIAAVKLGVEHVLGVDRDPGAVRVALANARTNGVEEKIQFATGSVPEILEGTLSLRRAPLVAVNIIAPVLSELLDQGLVRTVAPGGVLVLSGMLAEQAPEIEERLEDSKLVIKTRKQQGDWVGLLASRGILQD